MSRKGEQSFERAKTDPERAARRDPRRLPRRSSTIRSNGRPSGCRAWPRRCGARLNLLIGPKIRAIARYADQAADRIEDLSRLIRERQ